MPGCARLQHLLQQYNENLNAVIASTDAALQSVQRRQEVNQTQLQTDKQQFYERIKKLWNAYKVNTQTVDDTSSEANNTRVALDVVLNQGPDADHTEAVQLLKQHWKVVADHVEACVVPSNSSSNNSSTKAAQKAAIQRNADKMLFCAKNRAQVLKNAKAYRSTAEWVQALKKWDDSMKELEKEAHALRKAFATRDAQVLEPVLCDNHSMIVTHRQWKRLVYALVPMSEKLKKREQELGDQRSTMYAVLLNKVGYELKHGLDLALQQATAIEKEHSDTERAQVEAEELNFKLLSDKYQSDSRYMDAELQGYGEGANKCRELITKLFKLKTWEEHAQHLKSTLKTLQPLVVSVSKSIENH